MASGTLSENASHMGRDPGHVVIQAPSRGTYGTIARHIWRHSPVVLVSRHGSQLPSLRDSPACSPVSTLPDMATDRDANGHSEGGTNTVLGNPKGSTDPSVYNEHHKNFSEAPLPSKPDAWIQRAVQLAAILSKDAVVREKENKSPFAEVSLLKSAGLTRLLGPIKYGGGGQSWDVAYKVIREIVKGDGSLGQLLGYHLLWSWTSAVVGTDEQNERTQKAIIENNYFVGGAVNPRDNDLKIADRGDHIVFSGFKHFNTGGVVSDLTVLEGVCLPTVGSRRMPNTDRMSGI